MERAPPPGRQRFLELVAGELRPADLALACLLVACEEYPDMEPSAYLVRLDALGDEARLRVRGHDPREALQVVGAFLSDEVGLRGNAEDYHDPRNSFLNEVLDRGLGLPLTLAVVYLHVAARAGLEVFGAGVPGHFMVAARTPASLVYVDAFRGGRLRTEEECREFLRVMFDGRISWSEQYAAPHPSRRTLARLLYNLKRVYLERAEFGKMLWVQDLLVAVCPGDASELRDRGLVKAQLGLYAEARRDLVSYLEGCPEPPADAWAIAMDLRRLRHLQQMMN